jgi:phosphatidylserine/phosphatidylglycerophosphate/cardiolipin synthase-like enzyme
MARSFDSYWNNPRAYPVQSLITEEELARIRSQALPSESDGAPAKGAPSPSAHADLAWNEEPMDLRSAEFAWAPAVMLVDKPAKIALDGEDTPVPTEGAAPADTVVDGLLNLMDRTRKDLLIISPYFVPGEDMKKAFADARARGVRVRVLTNSLASNDAPIAHVGYARHREDLLAMGVELYELRSEQAGLRSAFGSSGGGGSVGASRSMLHSKVMVMDGRLVAVGSMNLDLRSQLQNTEIALLIRSRALAAEAAQQIEAAMREASWHLQRTDSGTLVWRAPEGSGLADAYTDPDASLGLRLLLRLLGPLAPDHLL